MEKKSGNLRALILGIFLGMFSFLPGARSQSILHGHVMVFIPAYEGSTLYDPGLAGEDGEAPCVWGSVTAIRSKELYYALRMPNRLEARPMLKAGPIDIYGQFVGMMTRPSESQPDFIPYTEGKDFFYFSYDWRQDMGTVTAPALAQAMEQYAVVYSQETGTPPESVRFVLVAHSMGGLIVRTVLSQNPRLAPRVKRAILIGTPNLGSVKAIKTLLVGPGGLKENPSLGWLGFLINLLPNSVDALTTRIVAISRVTLFELLPLTDPRWEQIDDQGKSRRVAAEDLLNVGTWRPFWPTAETERHEFLVPWLERFKAGPEEPEAASAWSFCQDPSFNPLQRMLAQTRDWRVAAGTLRYADKLLTEPGGESRLRVVVGTGYQTPTGLITEGTGDNVKWRYTYADKTDGDETVTAESVIDDLKNPEQIIRVRGATHGKLMSHLPVIEYLQTELSQLNKVPELLTPQPDMRPAALIP